MAGAPWHIEFDDEQALGALRQLAAATGDLEAAFADIGEHLIGATKERIDAEVTPEGDPFERLSPRYRARKKKNKDKILILDGHLRDMLHWQADPHQLLFGSSLIYAATQQYGRDEIPARPFVGFSAEDRVEIRTLIEEHLASAMR